MSVKLDFPDVRKLTKNVSILKLKIRCFLYVFKHTFGEELTVVFTYKSG